ncbi:hypothetical protein J0X14_14625 [Muricauda sp. CAU 1633]|uniref:hypothetical protein n=1 Tax=Allomuricauda sp. CAU 1633 TaxID=2816036 RepID=UPI001A8EA569|nr:hypothetical protein [Muricauda sp. CAU 1633]MBO0323541.1 hypothetical protein [Muricauda sp. CAU 1633]
MIAFKSIAPVLLLICILVQPQNSFAQKKTVEGKNNDVLVLKKVGGFEEYSSTLDLNDSRRQLIMAGQNYQTNYGIYVSLEIEDSSMGSNFKTLKSVEFEIVNYKPTYFIGIDSVVVAAEKSKSELTFKIYTRALSSNRTYSLTKNELKSIHFENGSYLHSERYLNPMFPEKDANGRVIFDSDGLISCQPDNKEAFDFEFFYKDGRHVVRKEDYDQEQLPQTYKNEVSLTLPGKRCKQSFNKVVF